MRNPNDNLEIGDTNEVFKFTRLGTDSCWRVDRQQRAVRNRLTACERLTYKSWDAFGFPHAVLSVERPPNSGIYRCCDNPKIIKPLLADTNTPAVN